MKTNTQQPAATALVGWTDAKDAVHAQVPSRSLLDAEIYNASPARVGNRYPGQRNYHGLNWFSNTGSQLWHESLTERSALLWLDFVNDIVAIAAQPMKMTFADGSIHYPDFIALHSDMRQVVYNVKPAKFITAAVQTQFDNASRICEMAGWTHEVVPTFDPVYIRNIEWLANYRQPHSTPDDTVRHQLLDSLVAPLPVGELAQRLTLAPRNTARTAVYNLAWYGDIQLDLTTPLSDQSLVRKAPHVHN